MPVNNKDVMQLLCHVSGERKMKAAFKPSGQGSLVVGTTAFFGGLLAGPPGVALGTAIGCFVEAWVTRGQVKSIPQVILELPPVKQQQLYENVCAIIKDLDWNDLGQLKDLVMSNGDLQEKLLGVLGNYITTKLQGVIQYLMSKKATRRVDIRDVMQLLRHVSEERKMKAAFKHSRREALVVGTTAFFGGLLAGLPGLAVGTALGCFLGAWMSWGQFKPVSQIIQELPSEEQQQLYENVCTVIQNLGWNNMDQLTKLVRSNRAVQEKLLGVLGSYITTKLQGKIQYGK